MTFRKYIDDSVPSFEGSKKFEIVGDTNFWGDQPEVELTRQEIIDNLMMIDTIMRDADVEIDYDDEEHCRMILHIDEAFAEIEEIA